MIHLSSGHWSHDQQVEDAVRYMRHAGITFYLATLEDFEYEFPEFDSLVWSGSWVDAEESGVDPDYMHYVCDWIEAHTMIVWEDGEPVLLEPGDWWGACGVLHCEDCLPRYNRDNEEIV